MCARAIRTRAQARGRLHAYTCVCACVYACVRVLVPTSTFIHTGWLSRYAATATSKLPPYYLQCERNARGMSRGRASRRKHARARRSARPARKTQRRQSRRRRLAAARPRAIRNWTNSICRRWAHKGRASAPTPRRLPIPIGEWHCVWERASVCVCVGVCVRVFVCVSCMYLSMHVFMDVCGCMHACMHA